MLRRKINSRAPPTTVAAIQGEAPEPRVGEPRDAQAPSGQLQRQVTITWRTNSGGWLGRIVFAVLGAMLLLAVALVSVVVLLWLLLGVLALVAVMAWKTRGAGQSGLWTLFRKRGPRRRK